MTYTIPVSEINKVSEALQAAGFVAEFNSNELTVSEAAEQTIAEALLDYYSDSIPYGVLTGDEGDPIEWVIEELI